MTVSALITTYRRYRKVCRAIDAILRQTHPVDEIIVVDNGSFEREYDTLHDHYADASVPVTVVRLSRGTHTLPPYSLDRLTSRDITNLAITLSRGEWLAMCHDDDEWMPHRIERQVAAAAEFPKCELFNANAINRTPDGELLGVHHDYYGQHGVALTGSITDVTSCIASFNPMLVSALFVRRSLFDRVGMWQQWVRDAGGEYMRRLAASDWDFYRRAAAVTSCLRVNEPLVWYEVGGHKFEGHMGYNQ